MKKYLLTITMMLGIVSGIVASPELVKSGKVSWLTGENVLTLVYEDDLPTKVQVTLYDSLSGIVFSEVIKMPCGFRRPYNLEELPNGEYIMEVVDDEKIYNKKIKRNVIRDQPTAFVSKLWSEGDEVKYLLAVPNTAEEEITVSIYDSEFNLCYREKEQTENGFAKIYKMKRKHSKREKAPTFRVSDNYGDYVVIRKNLK